ncbi:FAD-binding oxidoreductase [Endomicrobium proavitum]|uniref:Glycolate oxidase subunit, FAD-linked n=1 Tax=Endomicrobium proavitum TaxID=1408281 RepID=A0A0G3WG35_9BACT|nr:FAD-binding oxidoreductase [Endomicrobium proavitum]AKL97586.1 glycolate oxidase subunit, FAD-linked [Endomicrobium proavitum]
MIIKKDKDLIQNYFEDNSGVTGAHASFAAIAENENDVPRFLKEMFESKTPVTVAGALTGNTASGLAFGGAVLSLEKLNKIGDIIKIDSATAKIFAQAGARLSDIKAKAALSGWMYPPDPTEKNATIGGNVSTNASGGRGFKFGVTRDYVLALTIIFTDGSKAFVERGKYFADANGEIVFETDLGKKRITLPKYKLPKIKNAAGYYNYPKADLIDVFIGSDGTLGVITEVALKLIPKFKEVFGGIVFFDTRDGAYNFVNAVKSVSKKSAAKNLKDEINAMSLEYFDKNALAVIKNDYPVIPDNAAAGIMFEQDVYENNFDVLMGKWVDFLESIGVDAANVWFASNEAEQENFRIFRHKIPERVNERVRKNKIPKVGTDFAVPEGKLADMVNFCEKEFEKAGLFNLTFGHIGENHLHANIIASNKLEYEQTREMYARIAQKAVELGGTVSAEHGIGKLKHIFLEKMLGEEGFQEMAKFKKSLDKAAILGQDNIFPKKYL